MEYYKEVYEFAASAGALEGYVYSRVKSELSDLDDWIRNLVNQHDSVPMDVRKSFQSQLDRTLGRALLSLVPMYGKDHHYVQTLRTLIVGEMPKSPDDFEIEKSQKA